MMINRSLKIAFFLFLFLLTCSAFAGQADIPQEFASLIDDWLTINEKALFKLRVFDGVFTLAVIVCCFLPLIVVNVKDG